ncbi:MAG: 6-phosphofructokinase [Candidatus Kapaibacteriota bacterium]|jgi:6-phosphofructokinase 1
MKRIAVFTSGGDAPGMNAHIRAVVRTCNAREIEVYGIMGGFQGMIDGKLTLLDRKKTVNIVDKGGTILKTSRSEEFKTYEGRQKAVENLKKFGIDGVIACGGDGTFHGAHYLHQEFGIKIVGTPGTIDNDLYGTYFTIGYDTAINTAADAIDRIRDTADSHGRVFVIEVMGRHAGHIAMDVGIACGAEYISVPEAIENLDIIYDKMKQLGMHSRIIIIIGEGGEYGGANEMAKRLTETYGIEVKTSVLGHIQRGGKPSVKDRVLASHLGMAAVDALIDGYTDVMIGRTNQQIIYTPLEDTWTKKKPIENYYFEMAEIIA